MNFMKHPGLILLLLASPAWSAQNQVCPDRIQLESAQIKPSKPSPRWVASVSPGPVWLSGFNLFDGPPEMGAQLQPEDADTHANLSVWRFSSPTPDLWLSCDYASGLFRLAMPVKQAVTECRAVSKSAGLPKVLQVSFTCQ
ncbi:STY0301 family protein [Curvibacter gracilis]|uniref:STY0301 family protein n=1 Tax=Curvibacter gracilis TaxID=230310 RepID=UPI00316AC5DD